MGVALAPVRLFWGAYLLSSVKTCLFRDDTPQGYMAQYIELNFTCVESFETLYTCKYL